MNWKEKVKKELEQTRELSDYISDDFQATQRLREIHEKAEISLEAIKHIEDFSISTVIPTRQNAVNASVK